MALNDASRSAEKRAAVSAGRRSRIGTALRLGLGLFLTGWCVMVAVLIAFRHPYRVDFTAEKVHSLSADTLQRLRSLKEEVKVIFPFLYQKDNPLAAIHAQILSRSRELLNEYLARNSWLKLEPQLDLGGNPEDGSRWKALCEQYDLGPLQVNRFIFLADGGKFRLSLGPDDLAVYDQPLSRHDRMPAQVRKFKAEAALTGVLNRIILREKKRIYAVEGHGEAGAKDDTQFGLGSLRRELEANGFEVNPLGLSGEPRVPANCDVLLIASPSAPFAIEDQAKVNDFLRAGGRLLVALGREETGLEALLDSWNVRVYSGMIRQRRAIGPRFEWRPTIAATDFNAAHKATESFRRELFGMLFSSARALGSGDKKEPRFDHLLRAGEDPRQPCMLDRNRDGRQDETDDVGRFVLAAAVWREMPVRPPPDYRHVDTRMVILGDATPWMNFRIHDYSHRDFILNAMNWLVGREEALLQGGSAWTERKLKGGPEIERFLFWAPLAIFPGIVLSFGAFVYFLRRS